MFVLLETGATPNVTSPNLTKRLGLKCEKTKKIVTFSNGSRVGVVSKVLDVSALFDKKEVRLDFMVTSHSLWKLMRQMKLCVQHFFSKKWKERYTRSNTLVEQ